MLEQTPILGGYDKDFGGVRLTEQTQFALVSLAFPLGGEAAATKAIKAAFQLETPAVGQSVANATHRLIRSGPDQALLLFEDAAPVAETAVQSALNGACYTTNQTDAWTILAIEGERVRQALERVCPLDLDPSAFPMDSAQRTVMEHMSAFIIRTGEDAFLLMSASSSARSFLHAIETSLRYTA